VAVAYRYLDPKWADEAAAGRFLLRRLSYYRSLECPQHSRDELEGMVEGYVDYEHFDVVDDSTPDRQELLRHFGIKADGMRDFTFSENRVFHVVPDYFVLCCTQVIARRMEDGGRSAIIRISDVDELGRRVSLTHADVLSGHAADVVTYEERRYDPRKERLEAHPFRKERRFMIEQEARVIWKARAEYEYTTLQVDCPAVSPLISRIR
jgi:hypothetical protein